MSEGTASEVEMVELHHSKTKEENDSDDGDDIFTNVNGVALLIDGKSLDWVLAEENCDSFVRVSSICKSVVCYRTSPLQKAKVVSTIKKAEKRISLAIGDGANDVSMIQKAHVGVGIFGKEGTQAARASDYAIYRFKHLKKLLFVHGRNSFIRSAGLIQYSFYKNITFTMGAIWFSFFTGFSGQTIYDSWVIGLFNVIYAALPPFIYGFFERDLSDQMIYDNPKVYEKVQSGAFFSKKTFFSWLLSAFWHSIVCFMIGFALFWINETVLPDGRTAGLWTFGCFIASYGIIVVNLRMALFIKTWNSLFILSVVGTLIAFFVTMAIYATFRDDPFGWFGPMYFVFFMSLSSPVYWLSLALAIVLALVPDCCIAYYFQMYKPDVVQKLRETEIMLVPAQQVLSLIHISEPTRPY
eukprot:TRINITY_DN4690_c0_g1_i1.p1 TRINITY_DN4690_c0_g1~~TRINITY_DN4690_c0_g1_i1.p1  ORF type:complete len:461 (-),score=59.27 TRINITY_DN4690_c0_g1_i1:23-1255(-)